MPVPFELKADVAAHLAKAVYGLQTQTNVGAAMVSVGSGAPNLHDTVDVGGATHVSGESGFGTKSGFGMISPLKGRQGEWLLVCRGTNSSHIPDVLTDLNIGIDRGPAGLPVHQGFNKTFKSMKSQVDVALRGKNPSRVHVVGHSLGGALANLFALDFAARQGVGVNLYTFGQPRVTTVAHTSAVEQIIGRGNTRRVLAVSDPVPMIPIWPFGHYPDGAHRFNPGLGKISVAAHSMEGSYIPACRGGWPAPMAPQPPKSVEYWLDKSMSSGGLMNAVALYALEKALLGILKAVGVVLQGALVVSLTMLDWLASVLATAGQKLARAGQHVARWLTAAMKFLGQKVVVKTADVTQRLIKTVLQKFMQTLGNVARRAMKMVG